MSRRTGLVVLSFLTAVLALSVLTPSASAHLVHCRSDGNHEVWLGAYLEQFDPNNPDTWESGLVEQGLVCCYQHDHGLYRDTHCDGWNPLGLDLGGGEVG